MKALPVNLNRITGTTTIVRFHKIYRSIAVIATIAAFISGTAFFSGCEKQQTPPNILFIAVDDLRPELNCYGKTQIISPNIDRLASEGVSFAKAYCTVPVCGATRASLLTGLHPTPTRFTDYKTRVDEEAAGIVTLPGHFKNNGYHTVGYGKIFHHPDDGLSGWSEPPARPDYPNDISIQEYWRDYRAKENLWTMQEEVPLGAAGPAWESADVEDNAYYDGKTAEMALARLDELAKKGEPFFLGVGFLKPHLPFNCPKKYWDLYDHDKVELADNPFMPENAPADAWFNYTELRSYANIAKDTLPIPEEQARWLRHGYYACVSYTDAQIGKVLDKLEELGLADNTIIVLWGDHGWSLGEHSLWCKHSCFNNAIQTPLIIKAPGKGIGKSSGVVSFLDIYPTLCELAGIPQAEHLKGNSLVITLNDPSSSVNKYIFSRWHNGETVVDGRYNYTEYFGKDGKQISAMLYDHEIDQGENMNVADNEKYTDIVAKLHLVLTEHMATRD